MKKETENKDNIQKHKWVMRCLNQNSIRKNKWKHWEKTLKISGHDHASNDFVPQEVSLHKAFGESQIWYTLLYIKNVFREKKIWCTHKYELIFRFPYVRTYVHMFRWTIINFSLEKSCARCNTKKMQELCYDLQNIYKLLKLLQNLL